MVGLQDRGDGYQEEFIGRKDQRSIAESIHADSVIRAAQALRHSGSENGSISPEDARTALFLLATHGILHPALQNIHTFFENCRGREETRPDLLLRSIFQLCSRPITRESTDRWMATNEEFIRFVPYYQSEMREEGEDPDVTACVIGLMRVIHTSNNRPRSDTLRDYAAELRDHLQSWDPHWISLLSYCLDFSESLRDEFSTTVTPETTIPPRIVRLLQETSFRSGNEPHNPYARIPAILEIASLVNKVIQMGTEKLHYPRAIALTTHCGPEGLNGEFHIVRILNSLANGVFEPETLALDSKKSE